MGGTVEAETVFDAVVMEELAVAWDKASTPQRNTHRRQTSLEAAWQF